MSFHNRNVSRSTLSSSSSSTINDYTPRGSSDSDRSLSSTSSQRDSMSSTISNISYLVPWIDTHASPDLPDLGLRRRAKRQSDASDCKHKYVRPLPPIPADSRQHLPSAECTRTTSQNPRPLRRLPIPPLRPLSRAGKSTCVILITSRCSNASFSAQILQYKPRAFGVVRPGICRRRRFHRLVHGG